ncbi:hypothetical protein NZA98_26885, partial [Escherichia coli]|nr:hypothetical protein [Escherichia coli]
TRPAKDQLLKDGPGRADWPSLAPARRTLDTLDRNVAIKMAATKISKRRDFDRAHARNRDCAHNTQVFQLAMYPRTLNSNRELS